MNISKELEKFCDFAISVGYLDEFDKSPLINIYMAHFYNSSGLNESKTVRQNEQQKEVCKHIWPISPNDGKYYRCLDCNELWPHTD